MSETECVTEFKLGDAVVKRNDFLHWANGTGAHSTWVVEAITISANKTIYHTSGGGAYTKHDLVPAKDCIILAIKHLQARQMALITMLEARGGSNE